MTRTWAVVLAGGASRRFGSDKLEATVDDRRLLEHAVDGLPPDAALIVVGPERRGIDRPMTYVREDPPGGGPAAAMIAGLRAVLAHDAGGLEDSIVVLPGDAPAAGDAARILLEALLGDPDAIAVVAVDLDGREQPLQLALRVAAAERLIEAGRDGAGQGVSARSLVRSLGPDLVGLPLRPDLHADIDTPADLERWRRRS